jgi:hypothetical protein
VPLTKISLTDLEGNVVHEVELDVGADPHDIDSTDWPGAIVWNNRVFTAFALPDCDDPDLWQLCFEEQRAVLLVAGGKEALLKAIRPS